jgi:acyl-CoA thioesterase
MSAEREQRFRRAAVGAFFGFVPGERSAAEARVTLAPRPELLQGHEHVHGGVLAALADTAAAWLVYPALEHGRDTTTIELKLNFLEPATLAGGELVAIARLVRRGRTIAVVDVEIEQGATKIAKGLFTYLVFERAKRSGQEHRGADDSARA